MAPSITNAFLPPGSLILVTATNGLIASHITDQLLAYGYRVRGTVRSISRSRWLPKLFQFRHPNCFFELVEVPDITLPGCYYAAMKGVSAVIHTAAFTLSPDPSTIPNSIKANLNVLESAARANRNGEKIHRVVITSSSWACAYPKPNTPALLTQETYDVTAEKALANPNTPEMAKGLMTYVASKTISEQESWKWMSSHPAAGFTLNTVLPATCIGPVLAPNPHEQEYPSTAGFVRRLFEGKDAPLFEWLEPQWCVDVRDAARLHIAAAVLAGVQGERVFAWAETYTWPDVKQVLERTTGKKVETQLRDKGTDLTVPVEGWRERATEMLKSVGVEGWGRFDQAVEACIKSYYPDP